MRAGSLFSLNTLIKFRKNTETVFPFILAVRQFICMKDSRFSNAEISSIFTDVISERKYLHNQEFLDCL